ncbi:hypothetical protein, partial [Foetidibacter luteolus]|uniref:hypothetical protein n=1 Tax=Foetidibacter luteolus TaxID=2608880 RepID=UPI001A98E4FB
MKSVSLQILLYLLLVAPAISQSLQDTAIHPLKNFYEYIIDSTRQPHLSIFLTDRGSHIASTSRNFSKQTMPATVKPIRKPWLTVHGNVLYDVNYYSNIDTPFLLKDVYQHTLQAYLDITVKDHYPMRVYFTTRFGNTGLFRNFTNANMLYSSNMFSQHIKERLKQKMFESARSLSGLDSLKNLLEKKYHELDLIKKGQADPGILQKMVEARERAFARQLAEQKGRQPGGLNSISSPGLDAVLDSSSHNKKDSILHLYDSIHQKAGSIPSSPGQLMDVAKTKALNVLQQKNTADKIKPDSSLTGKADSIINRYDSAQKHYDSLYAQVMALQQKYNRLKELYTGKSLLDAKQVDAIRNSKELRQKMQELDMPDSSMPKGYKTLMALKTLGIGTNILNYSELSVKNISATGVQVEYNPSWYLAFAAGTVEYRFRDFIVSNNKQPGQYVAVLRAGMGMKEGNNVIFTYYTGRRQMYNYFTDTISRPAQSPSPYIMGFTVEGNYRIDRNNLLTAEIAKSSAPYYTANKPSGALSFKDHSNEAYSIKLASFIPATQTSFNGYYKRMGINFQSFSIFTNGSAQNAFNIRVSQPLYNGNISSMGVNVEKLGSPLLYNYHYDQLNRLVGMNAHQAGNVVWAGLNAIPDFKETISYDPNGNILSYDRNGNHTFAGKPLAMDKLGYRYKPNTNQLDHITDDVNAANYTEDIDGQGTNNYEYDEIGNLVKDKAEGIGQSQQSKIEWTVYGKISSI